MNLPPCDRVACLHCASASWALTTCISSIRQPQAWGVPCSAAGASRIPGSRPCFPGSSRGWRLFGLRDGDGDGRMERDPKLPRICAFLTLWLQRKHRAKPCRLQLPAPSQLSSPVSTAATSLCFTCCPWLLIRLGRCFGWIFGAVWFAFLFSPSVIICLMVPVEEPSLGARKACVCCTLVARRCFCAGDLFWCAAKQAVGAGLQSPNC